MTRAEVERLLDATMALFFPSIRPHVDALGFAAALLVSVAACGGRSALPGGTSGGKGGATASSTGAVTASAASSTGTTTSTASGSTSADAGAACTATRVPRNHRPSEGPGCPQERAPGNFAQECPDDPGTGGQCARDSDCTTGINGRCMYNARLGCTGFCTYDECFSDSDCTGNVPCSCRSSAASNDANFCLTMSTCRVDADCGSGAYCSPSQVSGCLRLCSVPCDPADMCSGGGQPVPCSCGTNCGEGYFCHTACDPCVDDGDCDGGDGCTHLPGGGWACIPCAEIP